LGNRIHMAKLAEWCEEIGVPVGEKELSRIFTYFEELSGWNQKVNLVAKATDEEILRKHFVDSLTCLPFIPEQQSLRLLDIGTGAGFPGLVLKVMRPDVVVHLLESSGKKCFFLKHVISTLKLDGVEILNGRAEHFAHIDEYRHKYDVVVCRAVAHLSVGCEYAFPFLRTDGLFIAQKGPSGMNELEEASGALAVLGGEFKESREFLLPGGEEKRLIFVFRKKNATPPEYPRREGVPSKKPLHGINVPRGT